MVLRATDKRTRMRIIENRGGGGQYLKRAKYQLYNIINVSIPFNAMNRQDMGSNIEEVRRQ